MTVLVVNGLVILCLSELTRFHFFLKIRGLSTLDYHKIGSKKGPSKINVQKVRIPKMSMFKELMNVNKDKKEK